MECYADPQNLNPNHVRSSSEAVAMETGETSEVSTVTGHGAEVAVSDSPDKQAPGSVEDQQVCSDAHGLDPPGRGATLDMSTLLPTGTIEIEELGGPGGDWPGPRQKEALILDSGREELNRNESIASSVSDTLSSADSVYENEGHRKRQDTQEQDPQAEEPLPDPYEDVAGQDATGRSPCVSQDCEWDPLCGEATGETLLEQRIREEAVSDVSNESCPDLEDPDELDECLRVEIATASSDSESDEKWRVIFSSSINKEDDDSYLDSLQLSAQELFVQKVEVNNVQNHADNYQEVMDEEVETTQEEELAVELPDDVTGNGTAARDHTLNPLRGQSKTSVGNDGIDEKYGNSGDDNPHPHAHHTEGDPNKKLPKDFCVVQETRSKDVSTEHVNFQVTRKQWLEMEEQTKNLVLSPTSRTGAFHGSHSFMYTPVRYIDRPKRHPSLESLPLVGEYPHMQFSPCSEDSGLDDSSYRSPYDDPETSIEREVHLSVEKEESSQQERGLSKSTGYPQAVKSPSSPLTPSFLITSSPAKAPRILVPDDEDDPVNPAATAGGAARGLGEWRSNGSSGPNLILLEASKLFIRSTSELCLNKPGGEQRGLEKSFLNNPFFKLRSRSTLSLVDEEIRMVREREEELRRERANVYAQAALGAPNMMDRLSFSASGEVPMKCKSSPSSPMKTAYKMDRSTLSCDHRSPEVYTSGGRRKSALALRWEAGEFANNED